MVWALELSPAAVKGKSQLWHSLQLPQSRVRVAGQEMGPGCCVHLALTWMWDSPHALLEVQERQGCPGSQATDGLGMFDVGCRPQARGLGEYVVTVQCLGGLLGPQHCHAPRFPPVPCFSEQNETLASALG